MKEEITMNTTHEDWRDNIKFITHPDKDGIMGSCPENCHQCERDEKVEDFISKILLSKAEELKAGLGNLRHELGQEESLMGDHEKWKEGHTKALEEAKEVVAQIMK